MSNEVWKDIAGYEGTYQVSNMGRVRSLDRIIKCANRDDMRKKGQIIRPYVDRNGYLLVLLTVQKVKTHLEVHRAVMNAFVGPLPPGHHTHHINDNRTDNRLENMVYLTKSVHTSVTHRGENARCARLKEPQVLEIKKLLAAGVHFLDIAPLFGVHGNTIQDIKHNRTWKHLLP
jgi:hypothetical protein